MSEPCIVPAGAIFMLSSGEYSDYRVQGTYITSEPIDVTAIIAATPFESWEDEPTTESIEEAIAALPCVRPIDVGELYLGEWGRREPEYRGKAGHSGNELARRLKMFKAATGEREHP